MGLNPRDTICFTVGEMLTVNDSLWSGVDHRHKRVVAARLIAQYDAELKASQRREELQRTRADIASGDVSRAVTAADQAGKDADFWKGKAKRRGWVGWGLGLLTAFLGYLGAQELGK